MLKKIANSLTVLGILALVVGCSTYPDGPIISLRSKEARIANTWKVSKATDENGDDKTSSFDGYRFIFSEDGTAVVDYGAVELNGSWELLHSDSVFHLDVATSIGFPALNAEFYINRLTEGEFWLEDKEKEKTTIELVTF